MPIHNMYTRFGAFDVKWFKDNKSGSYKIKDIRIN